MILERFKIQLLDSIFIIIIVINIVFNFKGKNIMNK